MALSYPNPSRAALRAAYRLGLDSDVITAMPRIKLLPENNVRKGFAEAKEVDAICKRLKPDVADGVRFALVTGWRRAEVCSLMWSQVDWKEASSDSSPGRRRTRKGDPSRSRPSFERYRRYAIVAESDLRDAGAKLSALDGTQESHRAR